MAREWYSVTDSAESVEIAIYGDIGSSWWNDDAVSAKSLLERITEARGRPIDLRINSGGGSVFDAYAMMTSLRRHDAKVTAYVDGFAGSAASFLLAAANEIVVSSVSWTMIHEPSGSCWGTAADMAEAAEWLGRIRDQIAGIYGTRSKTRDAEYFLKAMEETTWYTAEEAVEAGLADRVEEAVDVAACATAEKATIDSAPEQARALLCDAAAPLLSPGAPPVRWAAPTAEGAAGDGPCTVCTSTAGGSAPEDRTGGAQERTVVIDSKVYRMKGAEYA